MTRHLTENREQRERAKIRLVWTRLQEAERDLLKARRAFVVCIRDSALYDVEIADLLGLSKQRVGQIRKEGWK